MSSASIGDRPQAKTPRMDEDISPRHAIKKRPAARHCLEDSGQLPRAKKLGLETSILAAVKKLGHFPVEKKEVKTEEDKFERNLAIRIRKNWPSLTSDTRAELADLKEDGTIAASGFAKVKAFIAQMPSGTPEELMRFLHLMSQYQPKRVYMQEKNTKWWKDAGISKQHTIPQWCQEGRGSQQRSLLHTTLANIRYRFICIALKSARAFLSDGTHLACEELSKKGLYYDFFTSCSSAEKRDFEPYPEKLRFRSSLPHFKPFDCLRQLALIECVGQDFDDLPPEDEELLSAIHSRRANESSTCRVLSELHEAAIQRLIEYSDCDAHAYAKHPSWTNGDFTARWHDQINTMPKSNVCPIRCETDG